MSNFAEAYYEIRSQEGRMYSDEVLRKLPDYPKGQALSREWGIRKSSLVRLMSYLRSLDRPLKILDIGCGNGWMSHHLSRLPGSEVTAVDQVAPELEQAQRVFQDRKNLEFKHWDVFGDLSEQYDVVVMAASIQYFPDLDRLLGHLRDHLKEGGEIHVLDSPFYSAATQAAARERSRGYYQERGFAVLAAHYHHHLREDLDRLGAEQMYRPGGFWKWWDRKIFRKFDSPFYWFRFRK